MREIAVGVGGGDAAARGVVEVIFSGANVGGGARRTGDGDGRLWVWMSRPMVL